MSASTVSALTGGAEDESHAWSAVYFDEIIHAFGALVPTQVAIRFFVLTPRGNHSQRTISIARGLDIPASSCGGTRCMSQ